MVGNRGRQSGCRCRARTSDLGGAGRVGVWRAADPIISVVLGRFDGLDIPVNNAAVFTAKPLTDYATVRVNLAGFFWLTQRAIAEVVSRYGGHVVNVSAAIAEVADSGTSLVLAALTKGGLAAATGVAGLLGMPPAPSWSTPCIRRYPDHGAPGDQLPKARRPASGH